MANVLACAGLFSPSLFFMVFIIQQLHTQPVITTASSTIDKPNRAPRTTVGVLLTSDLNDD